MQGSQFRLGIIKVTRANRVNLPLSLTTLTIHLSWKE